jgi:hypothetical protein
MEALPFPRLDSEVADMSTGLCHLSSFVCGVSRFKVVRGRSSHVDLARRLTTRHVTRLHQIEVLKFDICQA